MTGLDDVLTHAPVVAVVRHDEASVAERIALAAADGGVRAIEITFTVPDAGALIERLVGMLPAVAIGAGTVLTPGQAQVAIDAGATFLVSPISDAAVLRRGADHGVPVLPGAFTPTEVADARRAGAHAVKVFPAASLGTGFVSALAEVFPDIPLVPTGGIAPAEAGGWLTAGAAAVGIAGAFTRAWQHGGADHVKHAAITAIAAATDSRSSA
ncbi:bifunctional 4-hydroxy-2-oxoglutarate aldolase/2-dehydro-3-deoxy-phosphogluconate aldolase [Agromyces sp. NPDC056523]|uniref:bifunctional 4-hydroxy-2-oxoglutarate aldolase/2-dehydro-3-deoxy-phosphogluconate aldolase n=1 Tax=Agromyces sp. NPDC056523 TaxID=3345850 RepID=UPI003670EB84